MEWTEHPSLAILLAHCLEGSAPSGTSSSQMVTVAILGPVFSPAGVETTFVQFSASRGGVPAESPLLSPPAGETAALVGPSLTEGSLVPYCPPHGPLEWPSRDDAGDTRFVLNDSREDKLWRHMGRQGLEAKEVLASAKGHIALLLEEVERAEKLVTSGLPPAVGGKTFSIGSALPACKRSLVTSLRLPGAGEDLEKEIVLLAGGAWLRGDGLGGAL